MIVTNGKIYKQCDYCKKIVRLNKPFIGSTHVCISDVEKIIVDCKKANIYLQYQEINYTKKD